MELEQLLNSATPYLEYQRRLQTSPPGGRFGGGGVEIPMGNLLISIGFPRRENEKKTQTVGTVKLVEGTILVQPGTR